ncbi:MAG: hypothetical protein JWO15_1843 [Sphingomonadales bacterium]|nr:hypothetical protein [Sphingomonadales bacterium]
MPPHRFYAEDQPSAFTFVQVAWVVDDLIATAHDFARIWGAGPFHVMRSRNPDMTYRGEKVEPDVMLAVAQMGPVQIELIEQRCDTPTIYTRELKAKGGVHHMCSFAADYDAARDHYAANDCPLISEIRMPEGNRVGYFDTLKTLGMLTEVCEENAGLRSALKKIAETCATWDGTDPVRILTRDGYRLPA